MNHKSGLFCLNIL